MFNKRRLSFGIKKNNHIEHNLLTTHYLRNDYKIRSDIIYNISKHVEKLYDNYVVTSDDRKKILIMINDLINDLNHYYNTHINSTSQNNKKDTRIKWETDIDNVVKTIDVIRKNNMDVSPFFDGLELMDFIPIDKSIKKYVLL